MNNNQKSISKHRTGGGGGGINQSQGNQRGDYNQRSNQDRYQTHRGNNATVSAHVGTLPMTIQTPQMNAATMQTQMIRNYPTNQQPPQSLLHQSPNMQLGQMNPQQQPQQSGGSGSGSGAGATPVVPPQAAMSNMINAVAAAQQSRFPSFVQPQQQPPRLHANHIRPPFANNSIRPGSGGAVPANTGSSSGTNAAGAPGIHLGPHISFGAMNAPATQGYAYSPHFYNQYPRMPNINYQMPPYFFINNDLTIQYPMPPANMAPNDANAALNNQTASYKPNDAQQPHHHQQPVNIMGQQHHHQPQHTQQQIPQPIKKREKKLMPIYNEKGELLDLEQLASESKNKPSNVDSNYDTLNENRPKTDKNVDDKIRKTELSNGPMLNDESSSKSNIRTLNDQSTNENNLNETKIDDNHGSSLSSDRSQQKQQKAATPPTTTISPSDSPDGANQKSSCDITNEPTPTNDLSSSSSTSLISDQNQSKSMNEIDEVAQKFNQMSVNQNDIDNKSSTKDSESDFVQIHTVNEDAANVNNNNNTSSTPTTTATDQEESLEKNSTTSRDPIIDENNSSNSNDKQSTTTAGDMESSFEIIDPIITAKVNDNNSADNSSVEKDVNHDNTTTTNNKNNNNDDAILINESSHKNDDDSIDDSKNVNANSEITTTNHINNNNETVDSRQYSRDFLWNLRLNATEFDLSHSSQKNVLDIIRKNDSLLPLYARGKNDYPASQYRNKSMIQQTRRPSQPSKNMDQKSQKIASTSLRAELPPNSTGWRPGKIESDDPEEIETEILLKNVRSILNKLTPDNYNILMAQFKELKIDTKDRLARVIDVIFDKAVLEPEFVAQYADFCSQLVNIKVNEENETGQVKFKTLLISKCQKTFYENSTKIDSLQKMETSEDPEQPKQSEEPLEEDRYSTRNRSIGNIKLIAELFKLNMLNVSIMFSCFDYLFKNFISTNHEDYIECLCALMTKIGKAMTEQIKLKYKDGMSKFDDIFKQLEKVYNKEIPQTVSPRMRFLILDLLELRENQWVPRRKTEVGPKSISQVKADFEEQQRIKNESANEMKKRQRSQQQHYYHQQQQNVQNNDEWQQVNKRKSQQLVNVQHKSMNFALFKNISSTVGTKNESGLPFSMFTSGSHGGSASGSQSRSSSTNYDNKSSLNDKNQRSYHDSLNAKNYSRGKMSSDRHYRSDSQQSFKSSSSMAMARSPTPSSDSLNRASSSVPDISLDMFRDKTRKVVSEYLKTPNYCDNFKTVQSFCSKTKCADFIAESILIAIEKTSQEYNPRQRWGEFLGKFFCSSLCGCNDIFEGLKAVFANYEDIILDLPNFFQFVADIIAYASLIVYKDKNCSSSMKNDIFKSIVKAYNEISGSVCASFRDQFLSIIEQENKALFDEIRPDFHSAKQPELDKYVKLGDFIKQYIETSDLNKFISQIKENFSNKESDKEFKCALYYKILDACFNNNKTIKHGAKLDKMTNLIKSFVKSNDDELLFLNKCVTLFEELNRPSNLLPEIFSHLNENEIIHKKTFLQWINDEKNVIAVMSVKRFIETL